MSNNQENSSADAPQSSFVQGFRRDLVIISLAITCAALAIVLFVQTAAPRFLSENIGAFAFLTRGPNFNASCQPISSLPFKIKAPGSYCLTRNLSNTQPKHNSILILADGVTLDGQNFCITGSTDTHATQSGIRGVDRKEIVIKNICINGHNTGILIGQQKDAYRSHPKRYGRDVFGFSQNIRIVNSSFSQQLFQAIHVRGSNILIAGNSIQHVGGYTADENAFATGIYVDAINCSISNNRVFDLQPSGNGEAVGIGLYLAPGCTVTQNHIDPFRMTKYGRRYGIWVRPFLNNYPVIKSNTVVNVEYAFGPFGVYTDNVAHNVSCRLFVDRIFSIPAQNVQSWLSERNNTMLSTPKTPPCKDNPEHIIAKAIANLNRFTSYAVASALAEKDPATHARQQLSWFLLSAELGHKIALSTLKASPTAGYSPSEFAGGKEELKKLKAQLNLDKADPVKSRPKAAVAN